MKGEKSVLDDLQAFAKFLFFDDQRRSESGKT
jgi:hypothetical protein